MRLIQLSQFAPPCVYLIGGQDTGWRLLLKWDRAQVLTIWGLLDLSFIGWVVGGSLLAGRVPIYSNLLRASEIAISFENSFPVVVTALSIILYVSIMVSGTLLYRRKPLGAMLAYAQLPFRVALSVPSLFFIPWLLAPLPLQFTVAGGIVLMIGSELFKLWSLWFGRTYQE